MSHNNSPFNNLIDDSPNQQSNSNNNTNQALRNPFDEDIFGDDLEPYSQNNNNVNVFSNDSSISLSNDVGFGASRKPTIRNPASGVGGRGNDLLGGDLNSSDPYISAYDTNLAPQLSVSENLGPYNSYDQYDPYDQYDDYLGDNTAATGIVGNEAQTGFKDPLAKPRYAVNRQSGLAGVYSNVKSRLGLGNPDYTEMDLPLTEQDAYVNTTGTGSGARHIPDRAVADIDEEEPSKDFDIRKYYYKIIRRKRVDPASLGPRIINLNNPSANHSLGYHDNHISTTKYNIATFLPKFLFEQFSKYANLFFLCTSAIQQVPNVSPTNRYTTIGTLAIVLTVSAIKELIEDFKRNSADKELNNSLAEVLVGGSFEKRRWIKVAVGDIVRVNSEEPFPADLVLLASSEPEGLCYIETANLDGETNLKIKQAVPETSHVVSPDELGRITGKVFSEQPNSSLYTYEATLHLESGSAEKKIPINPDQLLLRGATLRNTPWIHGLVVFTGHETKLMRNATAAPIKRTAVEHMLNLQIIFLFTILMVLAIVSSLGNVIKVKVAGNQLSYLYLEGTSLVKLFFSDILTYWVLFSNLVPIR